jgi:hypothetical protein
MQYFQRYFNEYQNIAGWTTNETLYAVWLLVQFQYKHLRKVDGAIGEIGVHEGKLTSYLYLMRHRDRKQKLFVVDVFSKQSLNIDASGSGNRDQFLKNVKNYADVTANELIIYEGSSLDLNPLLSKNNEAQLFWSTKLGEKSCQLVSIDGGHTTLLTYSDLCLISNSLVDGGIVMVDDIDNSEWLGVRDGVAQFFAETSTIITKNNDPELAVALNTILTTPNFNLSCRIIEATTKISKTKPKCSRLVPILQHGNKLYLTTPNYYPHYIQFLNKLNDENIYFIRYDTLRSTVGNVPVWSDNKGRNIDIFNAVVKPMWMSELTAATG